MAKLNNASYLDWWLKPKVEQSDLLGTKIEQCYESAYNEAAKLLLLDIKSCDAQEEDDDEAYYTLRSFIS